jgi:RNA polymerase sigma-70 factor, ECF subfamily
MNRSDEHMLVQRALSGGAQGREAMASLVREHQGRLYAFMLRMTGRPDVAEEVVQEAFVRALRSLSRFDPQFRFSTWLYTIARRVYWNMRDKCAPAPRSDLLSGVEHVAPVWSLAGWAVERNEGTARQREALQRALLQLPEVQREVVILFHQQDWPVWLIAKTLEMPEGTVKSHLHRGRVALRNVLEPIWRVDTPTVTPAQATPARQEQGRTPRA